MKQTPQLVWNSISTSSRNCQNFLHGTFRAAPLDCATEISRVGFSEKETAPATRKPYLAKLHSTSSRNCQNFRHVTFRAAPLDCATEISRVGFSEKEKRAFEDGATFMGKLHY